MPWYRAYLLTPKGNIGAATDTECENDDEAIIFGGVILDAALDVFPAIEIWEQARRVACLYEKDVMSLGALSLRRQENVVEAAVVLSDSFAAIRNSRRMLERLSSLQTRFIF